MTSPGLAAAGTPTARLSVAIPAGLAAVTVLTQITWVLVDGAARDALTVIGVVCLFAASLSHALLTRGLAWTVRCFGTALAFGWAIEAVGTATGIPFGDYGYGARLGPTVAGVPLLIPLAWAMMAYPCHVVAARAARSAAGHVVLAATTLAAWDLFLDPQMVAEGHWTFAEPDPALPGVPGTPIGNYVGWLAAAMLLLALLALVAPEPLGDPSRPVAVPVALLAWVYGSNVLANLAFWGRPAVALIGGIGMGIPLALMAWRLADQSGPPEPVGG